MSKEIKNDETKTFNHLIGLILIVYAFLCVIFGNIGAFLNAPLSFLFGSFSLFILAFIVFLGLYMLLFSKPFTHFKALDIAFLALAITFLLTFLCVNRDTITSSFFDTTKNYLNSYSFKHAILWGENSLFTLKGGLIGHFFYGLICGISKGNYVLTYTIALSLTIFFSILFLISFFSRFKNLFKKENKNDIKKDENKNISFKVKIKEEKNKDDALLKVTSIKITGDNYSFSENSDDKESKLEAIIDVFDDEIYNSSYKGNYDFINDKTNNETQDIILREVNDNDVIKEINEENFPSNNPNEIEIPFDITILKGEMEPPIEEVKDEEILKELDDGKNIIEEEAKPLENKEEKVIEKIENKEISSNTKITLEDSEIENKLKKYTVPPLFLLKEAIDNGANIQNEEFAKEQALLLQDKLKELNVSATINTYVVGPAVTRFEISLAPGVRVGTFLNLQEDLKLALGVNSIRIESPIPGKSAIGLEVPNKVRAMVSLKEIITSMPNKKEKLFVPVGKDITGIPLSFPICNMPHCLISGATNSGKSVCANTIILSLLMNYKPDEVKFIMVDPKRVEMSLYQELPHLLCPIITESEKARVALEKLCTLMDQRFQEFANVGVKNIASYNELKEQANLKKMSFIILVVDEFAELMLCKNHAIVEEKIQKIAQLGRAAGIHLILATQRPDVNVIPGTIKTNLPCRMTFRLSSTVDSRTVIDVGGAEKLLNNGDMLLLTPDFTGLRRVQGTYVSDTEIEDVVNYCKKQIGPLYDPMFMDLRSKEEIEEEEKLQYAMENNIEENNEPDPMYEDIKKLVISEQKASTSYLQIKMKIGYARAARYIDQLEMDGIIGPASGAKPREILISKENIENN